MTNQSWQSLGFMPFREFLKTHAKHTHFRSEYLGDQRKPNHTSWKELQAYLMASPWVSDLADAKRAWDMYRHIPAVEVEAHRFNSLMRSTV